MIKLTKQKGKGLTRHVSNAGKPGARPGQTGPEPTPIVFGGLTRPSDATLQDLRDRMLETDLLNRSDLKGLSKDHEWWFILRLSEEWRKLLRQSGRGRKRQPLLRFLERLQQEYQEILSPNRSARAS